MALDISIGRFKITSDDKNFILQEKKTAKEGKSAGEEYFVTVGYYGRVEDAAKRIIDQQIKSSECKELKEVIQLIRQVKVDIDQSLGY